MGSLSRKSANLGFLPSWDSFHGTPPILGFLPRNSSRPWIPFKELLPSWDSFQGTPPSLRFLPWNSSHPGIPSKELFPVLDSAKKGIPPVVRILSKVFRLEIPFLKVFNFGNNPVWKESHYML